MNLRVWRPPALSPACLLAVAELTRNRRTWESLDEGIAVAQYVNCLVPGPLEAVVCAEIASRHTRVSLKGPRLEPTD